MLVLRCGKHIQSADSYIHVIDHMQTTVYIRLMFELVKSATFYAWFRGLRDVRAKARIATRLDRVADGNLGD